MGDTNTPGGPKGLTALLAGTAGHTLRWAAVPAMALIAVPALDIASGGHGGAAVMAALADPMTVLAGRSPGGRPAGALTQSKRKAAPAERVLSDVLTRPLDRLAAPGGVGSAPGVATVVPVVSPAGETALPATETAGVTPGAIGPILSPSPGIVLTPDTGIPPGTVITPGAGGGGGGGGGAETTPPVTVTPVTPVTPAPAVPEPGTWLTLMVGFGAVGGALRLRRRTTGGKAAVPPRQG